jgi:hypothetical protein
VGDLETLKYLSYCPKKLVLQTIPERHKRKWEIFSLHCRTLDYFGWYFCPFTFFGFLDLKQINKNSLFYKLHRT